MKLDTLDLYFLSQCPRRWKEQPIERDSLDPTRDLIRKVFLMKALGRETGWTFSGIASVWDDLFWKGKDINRDNIKQSVQGILAARQLYKRLPKGSKLEAHSSGNLICSLDSGLLLSSSSDFLLSYSDRYEAWVYFRSAPIKIRRSPLPAIEHYLVHQKIRDAHKKPFYVVIYYSSVEKRRTIHFRVRDTRTNEECRKIVHNLADIAKKEIYFPSQGDHCKDCSIKC